MINKLEKQSIAPLNKFTSVNIHFGGFLTYKDDLESLCYILLYFINEGKWPNKNLNTHSHQKWDEKLKAISLFKLTTSEEKICENAPGMKSV